MAMGDLDRIGLVAVRQEIVFLLGVLQREDQERHGEAILHLGSIEGRPVALAEVLIGPVNAALGAQALITRCGATCLIGFGSAGALDGNLKPGDLVITQRAVAHDAGRFLGHRFQPSGIMGRDRQGRVGLRWAFEADPDLVALGQSAAHKLGSPVQTGTVATGNQAIFSTARKRWLRQTFDALIVEMETAAVAQAAAAHGLPWVAVRAVSDRAGDDLVLDYRRLQFYLGDGRPTWQQQASRWFYLLTHPTARRRLHRLRRGLALASEQASRLVEMMLQTWNHQ
jgi:adenosylhomocysteine nucleosidase